MSSAKLKQAWIELYPTRKIPNYRSFTLSKHSSNVAFGHIQRKEMKKRGCQMSAFCYGSQAVCITNKEISEGNSRRNLRMNIRNQKNDLVYLGFSKCFGRRNRSVNRLIPSLPSKHSSCSAMNRLWCSIIWEHTTGLSTNLRRQLSNQNISTNGRPAMSFILLKDPKILCDVSQFNPIMVRESRRRKICKKTIHEAIAMCEPSKGDDPFAKNAAAVLHYYSLLSLFNDGSLSTVTDIEHPGNNLEMHPTFYPKEQRHTSNFQDHLPTLGPGTL